MADYLVESQFIIKDGATRPLTSIISSLERMDTKLNEVTRLFGSMTQAIIDLRAAGGSVAMLFGDLNTELTAAGSRMQRFTQRTEGAAVAMETMGRTGLRSTFVMADMATEAERVAATMTLAAQATTAAGRAAATMRNFGGMGGAGTGGGGGRGAGHSGGILGRVGGFASHAANAAMLGMIGMDIAKEGLEPGLEYMQSQSRFKTVGVPFEMQATAKKEAERVSTKLGVASPSQVLDDIYHMYGVTKSLPMAIAQAEQMAKGEAVLKSIGEHVPAFKGQERDLAGNVLRAAEMTGNVAFSPNDAPGMKKFDEFLNNMVKMLAMSGGNISAQQFKQTLVTMRSSRIGASAQTLFQDAPFFMQEAGGKGGRTGSVGAMFSQFGRHFQMGALTQAEAGTLMDEGLLGGSAEEMKKLRSELNAKQFKSLLTTIKKDPRKFIKDFDLLIERPADWILETRLPAILQQENKSLGGPGTNAQLMERYNKLSAGKQKELLAPHMQGHSSVLSTLFLETMQRREGMHAERARFKQMPNMDQLFGDGQKSLPMTLARVNTEFQTMAELLGDRFQKPILGVISTVEGMVTAFNRTILTFNNSYPNLAKLFDMIGNFAGWAMKQGFLNPGNEAGAAMWGKAASGANYLAGMIPGVNNGDQPPPPGSALGQFIQHNRRGKATAGGAQSKFLIPPPPPGTVPLAGPALGPQSLWAPPNAAVAAPPSGGGLSQFVQHSRAPITVNNNFHGPIMDQQKVKKLAAEGTAQGLAKSQWLHNATTTQAGGHLNTPKLSGSNP
jgi:hypothetical protein